MKEASLFDCLTETEKKQCRIRGTISAAIENKRYELNLTQTQFAELLGVTQGMVSKLENSENKITVDKLIEYFEKLKIKYRIDIGCCKQEPHVFIQELCPHCENEIEMVWDVSERGYKTHCPVCGNVSMLCDECLHSSDSIGCDYDSEKKRCFRLDNTP